MRKRIDPGVIMQGGFMRNKIILMVGGTETLDYFSREMEKEFCRLGYETFLFEQEQEEESAEKLAHFAGYSDSILVTFNFDGLRYETSLFDGFGNLFWEERNIPCVNIAVDHPFFYPEFLDIHPDNFYQVSIDRFHQKYLKKYYPHISSDCFLPLGGTSLYPDGGCPSLTGRSYDVVFTGNYTPKETFDKYIYRLGDEYAQFYLRIIEELISYPDKPDDLVMEAHLRQQFPDASDGEISEVIANMIFIDTYIRNYYRGEVVKALVDGGIPVHCIGHGWDIFECRHPENLSYEKNQYSLACLQRIADARISLNVMPWFKDGAHDRVFNAMANGSVCLTDHSIYLDEILTDRENAVFYDLKDLSSLPGTVTELLSDMENAQRIATKGYQLAMREHTWACRVRQLEEIMLKKLN